MRYGLKIDELAYFYMFLDLNLNKYAYLKMYTTFSPLENEILLFDMFVRLNLISLILLYIEDLDKCYTKDSSDALDYLVRKLLNQD